jgi:hypothetical protein
MKVEPGMRMILKRQANAPVVFMLLGLIVGALIGYETRPAERSEIRIGPVNIEVQGKEPSARDKVTSDQKQHIAIITLTGGVIGLGLGFAIQRSI